MWNVLLHEFLVHIRLVRTCKVLFKDHPSIRFEEFPLVDFLLFAFSFLTITNIKLKKQKVLPKHHQQQSSSRFSLDRR